MDLVAIEQQKAEFLAEYDAKLVDLYTTEIKKVFEWFVAKFPKRELEWYSSNGYFGWRLDGEELNCTDTEMDFNHWITIRNTFDTKARCPDRKMEKLMPLWDFFNSIRDHTNVQLNWIDIGNFNSKDFK